MNTDMRTYVITLLESYPKRERQIALLHYELAHPVQILPDEMIEAMALSHGGGTGRSSGYISNRTLHIALHYQEQAGSLNAAAKEEAANQLTELEQIQERLNYYVSLLDERQSLVIRRFYFEGHSWEEISQELEAALRTVHKLRHRAVDRLAEMYRFVENVNR